MLQAKKLLEAAIGGNVASPVTEESICLSAQQNEIPFIEI
jgi:hypothetical protein